MRNRRRTQQPPLKTATKLFLTGVIALIAAIVLPLVSVSCTNESGVQFCIETTYYGMDAHAFGIVLGVVSVLFFAGGVFYLRRHKQTLAARSNGALYPASQPFAPQQPETYSSTQQPGIYPPVQQWGTSAPAQNAIFPESNRGNALSQPPSNIFPQQ